MFAFLSSPLFRAGLVLAFVVGVFGFGYLSGKRAADQSARIAELERDTRDLKQERDTARAERDEVRRQAEAANAITADAASREAKAQADSDALARLVQQYEEERKANTNRVCLPDIDAANRLREIHRRALGYQ